MENTSRSVLLCGMKLKDEISRSPRGAVRLQTDEEIDSALTSPFAAISRRAKAPAAHSSAAGAFADKSTL
jgi:hypothetical protein